MSLPDKIAEDMLEFITKVADEPVNMKSLGLPMHLGVSGVFLIFCLKEYIIFETEPGGE